jgi:diamine N-acetyltransferase
MSDAVELRPVTRANVRACIALRVRPDQQDFVAGNAESLAEAYVDPDAEPRAVYRGDDLVGFVLLRPVESARPRAGHCIARFMIDHRYQGRGIGRRALQATIDWIVEHHRVDTVQLSVVPGNSRAHDLYRAAGFVETGELDDGEIVMVKPVAAGAR